MRAELAGYLQRFPDCQVVAQLADGETETLLDLLYENQERLGGQLFLGLAEELELAATALRRPHQLLPLPRYPPGGAPRPA